MSLARPAALSPTNAELFVARRIYIALQTEVMKDARSDTCPPRARRPPTGGRREPSLRKPANVKSLVEEESADEYLVEQCERRCWACSRRRFGGGKQATNWADQTDRSILDSRLAVCGKAKATPLNA